jgi:hypothetical protein
VIDGFAMVKGVVRGYDWPSMGLCGFSMALLPVFRDKGLAT